VLVESEATVCGNGSGWLAPQPRGLLREFDKGEKPISFYAHEASHVIGRGFRTIALVCRPHRASGAPTFRMSRAPAANVQMIAQITGRDGSIRLLLGCRNVSREGGSILHDAST